MKTFKIIIKYLTTFLAPTLLKVGSYIGLIKNVFGLKTNDEFSMNGYEIFELIATPFFFLGVFIYFEKKFSKNKEDIKSLIEKNREDSHEMDMFFANLEKRKRSYLYDCFKTGKILPEPKSWITDEEKRLYSKQFKDREKEIEMLNKSLSEE